MKTIGQENHAIARCVTRPHENGPAGKRNVFSKSSRQIAEALAWARRRRKLPEMLVRVRRNFTGPQLKNCAEEAERWLAAQAK